MMSFTAVVNVVHGALQVKATVIQLPGCLRYAKSHIQRRGSNGPSPCLIRTPYLCHRPSMIISSKPNIDLHPSSSLWPVEAPSNVSLNISLQSGLVDLFRLGSLKPTSIVVCTTTETSEWRYGRAIGYSDISEMRNCHKKNGTSAKGYERSDESSSPALVSSLRSDFPLL